MDQRTEGNLLRPLRAGGKERQRIGGDRELGKAEVLDDAIGVVAEAVSVHDLLHHLVVHLRPGLPTPVLDF
jgi:hypothetical protein